MTNHIEREKGNNVEAVRTIDIVLSTRSESNEPIKFEYTDALGGAKYLAKYEFHLKYA